MPETFAALPDDLPRHRQHQLLHAIRGIERDTLLWSRDHKAVCDPHQCGYIPE